MLTILGITFTYDALMSLGFFSLFAYSEYLGGNKRIKSNNVAQQLYSLLRLKRREDDKLAKILQILKEN
jgi:hypothetical protein